MSYYISFKHWRISLDPLEINASKESKKKIKINTCYSLYLILLEATQWQGSTCASVQHWSVENYAPVDILWKAWLNIWYTDKLVSDNDSCFFGLCRKGPLDHPAHLSGHCGCAFLATCLPWEACLRGDQCDAWGPDSMQMQFATRSRWGRYEKNVDSPSSRIGAA